MGGMYEVPKRGRVLRNPARSAMIAFVVSRNTAFRGRRSVMRAISASFCVLIVFSATILVLAKGTTTKITITSAELQSPIEISDPEVLKNFNVWSGPGTFVTGVE